jgi:porin
VRRGGGRQISGLLVLALVLLCPDGIGAQFGSRRLRTAAADTAESLRSGTGGGMLTLEAFYTGEALANLEGGIARGTAWRGVADLILTVDPASLWGGSGTRIGADLIAIHGDPPGELTGDWQGVSDIAAPQALRLYELWLQQRLFQDRLSLLVGICDINTTFDVLEAAALFLNSSHGMGPDFAASGPNGAPTYPYPGLSLLVRGRLSEQLDISILLADGVPGDPGDPEGTSYRITSAGGALVGAELAWLADREGLAALPPVVPRWQARRRRSGAFAGRRVGISGREGVGGPGRQRGRQPLLQTAPTGSSAAGPLRYSKVALGLWRYDSRFLLPPYGAVDPLVRHGSWGSYLLAERILALDRSDPQRTVGLFLRLGAADHRVEEIDRYAGCGFTVARRLPGGRQAHFGLALSAARLSRTWSDRLGAEEGAERWELAVEMTLRIQVNRWCALQPDFQYILHPGFISGRPAALAAGLRLELGG